MGNLEGRSPIPPCGNPYSNSRGVAVRRMSKDEIKYASRQLADSLIIRHSLRNADKISKCVRKLMISEVNRRRQK